MPGAHALHALHPGAPPPRLRLAVSLGVAWAVAVVAAGGGVLRNHLHDRSDMTWWGPILSQLTLATLWGLVTPVVFELARQFGDGPRRLRRLVPGVTVGVGLTVAFSAARMVLHEYEHTPETRPCGEGLLSILGYLHVDLGIFAAVFALGLAGSYLAQREVQRARAAASEAQLARARFAALQSQLNPHFLFNALNAISGLVDSDPAATRVVVARLSELLRRSLDAAQKAEVTLEEELRFVRGYLDIMAVRFGDRLRSSLCVDDGLADALVPAFVLQPLVENAFEHGIARILGPGFIELAVAREGELLRITVRDNGPGVADEIAPGIGLSNTAARLAELYPGRGALRLAADPRGGALAIVELPYRTGDEP